MATDSASTIKFVVKEVLYPRNGFQSNNGYTISKVTGDQNGRKREFIVRGKLPSTKPYFVYYTTYKYHPAREGNDAYYEILSIKKVIKSPMRYSILYRILTDELHIDPNLANLQLQNVVFKGPRKIADEKSLEALDCYGRMRAISDYYRIDGMDMLIDAMPHNSLAIRRMRSDQIQVIKTIFEQRPWMLCFKSFVKPLGIKEMSLDTFKKLKKGSSEQLHAVQMYTTFKRKQKGEGHTCMLLQDFRALCINSGAAEDSTFEEALQILKSAAAIVTIPIKTNDGEISFYISLKEDAEREQLIVKAFSTIYTNASKQSGPKIRNINIANPAPCRPKQTLNSRQSRLVEHVAENWLTIGVSSYRDLSMDCIAWLVMRYERVLVMTLVSRGIAVLNEALGSGAAYTIHNLKYKKQCALVRPEYLEWLSTFELVIIDNFTNVDDKLASEAFYIADHCKRLILMLDEYKLPPIKSGAAWKAVVQAFSHDVFRLKPSQSTETSALMKNACALMEERVDDMEYGCDLNSRAQMIIVNRGTSLEADILNVCKKIAAPDKSQIVTFDVRTMDAINDICMNYYLSGILPNKTTYNSRIHFFKNQKIRFTKSYPPKRVDGTKAICSGVRSGEIEIISRIGDLNYETLKTNYINSSVGRYERVPRRCIRFLETKTGKTIFISTNEYVDPGSIVNGWATLASQEHYGSRKQVAVYMPEHVGAQWYANHLYMTLVNASSKLFIIGSIEDIRSLSKRKLPERKTLLNRRLAFAKKIWKRNIGKEKSSRGSKKEVNLDSVVVASNPKSVYESLRPPTLEDRLYAIPDSNDENDSEAIHEDPYDTAEVVPATNSKHLLFMPQETSKEIVSSYTKTIRQIQAKGKSLRNLRGNAVDPNNYIDGTIPVDGADSDLEDVEIDDLEDESELEDEYSDLDEEDQANLDYVSDFIEYDESSEDDESDAYESDDGTVDDSGYINLHLVEGENEEEEESSSSNEEEEEEEYVIDKKRERVDSNICSFETKKRKTSK